MLRAIADVVDRFRQAPGGERIRAIGMGETQPIADNSTEEGRKANRRVEIILTPVTDGTTTTG